MARSQNSSGQSTPSPSSSRPATSKTSGARQKRPAAQIGRASRRKGKAGEREAAEFWREFYPEARRNNQTRGARQEGADIVGVPGWWPEIKRVKRIAAARWLEKTLEDQGDYWIAKGEWSGQDKVVVMAREDRGSWMFLVPPAVMRELLSAWKKLEDRQVPAHLMPHLERKIIESFEEPAHE